jgi:prepilin-type N-terminal cleavage/methylation domain-containing protein
MICQPHHHRGFSLVELMATMAIGAVILLAAADLLGNFGDGYERVGGGMATEREARALMTQLASDLSTARFHKDVLIGKSTATWPAGRLGFLSLQPAEAQSEAGRIGDLCAVGYYLKDLAINGKTVRCLMRGYRESNETFMALGDGSVSSLFSERGEIDEPIAFGVVSFVAKPKTRGDSGKWIDWVENDDAGPEALDVSLVIARRGLAGRLKLPADWDGAGTTGRLLGRPSEAGSNHDLETYGTMIRFGNDESR